VQQFFALLPPFGPEDTATHKFTKQEVFTASAKAAAYVPSPTTLPRQTTPR
jgi:hypothetical protein